MRPGLTPYRLASDRRSVSRIRAIVAERRSMTGETALLLGRYFRTSPEFWLNMQRDYELDIAAATLGVQLEGVKPRAA